MKEIIERHKNKLTLIFLTIGISLIILKGILPETIDQNGILNEYFYLLPIGFLLIIISISIYIFDFLSKKVKRQK